MNKAVLALAFISMVILTFGFHRTTKRLTSDDECLAKTCPAGYTATYEAYRKPACLCEPGMLP